MAPSTTVRHVSGDDRRFEEIALLGIHEFQACLPRFRHYAHVDRDSRIRQQRDVLGWGDRIQLRSVDAHLGGHVS